MVLARNKVNFKLNYKFDDPCTKLIIMHSGKALMLFRKFKNISQQEIAKKINTTQQYISELEKQENINGEKINKILFALNSNKDEWEKFKKLLQFHQV